MKYTISTTHDANWNGRYFQACRNPRTYSRKATAINVAREVRKKMIAKCGPQSNLAHIIVREVDDEGTVVKTINV